MAETIATIEQPAKLYLGEGGAYWCQTVVLLAAVAVAVTALIISRAIEKKKAAASIIFASRKDSDLISSLRRITTLHATDQSMATWARKDRNDSDEAKSIRYALNHWEYVSVGISQKIYDEKIFKSSSYTTVVKLYERTKPFIDEARIVSGSDTAFQDFECLACRWKEKPLKRKAVKLVPK